MQALYLLIELLPMSRYAFCIFLLFTTLLAQADYVVKGKVNMKGDWQYQIYLATIDKLDDYYSANAKYVINVASIDPDGHFILEGNNLPQEAQFYRLYVVKEEHSEFNACLFVGGDEHNYVHLILHNDSQVEVEAATAAYAPFGDYTIKGDADNLLMKDLSKLLYPSYYFYEIKFPSELKFSQDKLNRDLFNFADTCTSTLASLAAINNTDYDAYFATQMDQYTSFKQELTSKLPKHPYTKDYTRKLRYFGGDFDNGANAMYKWLSFLLGIVVVGLSFWIYRLKQIQTTTIARTSTPTLSDFQLTGQEIKILNAIKEGKANKEIASDLFIEVSTVKSHINKLYAKLKVSNRKEAIELANRLKK